MDSWLRDLLGSAARVSTVYKLLLVFYSLLRSTRVTVRRYSTIAATIILKFFAYRTVVVSLREGS